MDSSMEARDSMTTEASPLHSTASSSGGGGGGGGKARVLSLGTAVMAISVAAVAALGLVPMHESAESDGDGPSPDTAASLLIIGAALLGVCFALFLYSKVIAIALPSGDGEWDGAEGRMLRGVQVTEAQGIKLVEIYNEIVKGAKAFLWAEYSRCFLFLALFGALVFFAVAYGGGDEMDYTAGAMTAAAFVVGGLTSIVSGYIGMMVAVESNARTTTVAINADEGEQYQASFNAAFRAGGVMGYCLTGLSLLVLYAMCNLFSGVEGFAPGTKEGAMKLFECVAGFGLGGSSIAMFGRVGGGIYTKAADVGADLAGKVIHGIPEDDPRNPATIADNVGDNVGDVAGMGSDLFGSFAEATCAALVVSASSQNLVGGGWAALMFPLHISSLGIIVCMVTSFLATNISPVRKASDVEKVLKVQLAVTTALMTLVLYPAAVYFLPEGFTIERISAEPTQKSMQNWNETLRENPSLEGCPEMRELIHIEATPYDAYVCIVVGLWAGCIIGFVTEYYTSHSYAPTREVAYSCETGAATNIIYGLSLGYKSVIIPVLLLSAVSYVSFTLCDMYGVALAALGMLGTLSCCLSIDVYGPVCDNAGGVAEMAELDEMVRDCTDELDAAGNTTAAIGKGFAIGSATLVGLALFGAFITRSKLTEEQTSILSPMVFACLLLGAMIPYWFTAMTMKSVGVAAKDMVLEVSKQFKEATYEPKLTAGGKIDEAALAARVQEYADACGKEVDEIKCSHSFDSHRLQIDAKDEEPDWLIKRNAAGKVIEINLIMAKLVTPLNDRCISISTDASLREMVPPAALVMGSPLVVGVLLGTDAVAGLLAGAICSSVQLAISASNSGGAWDNAKKYVEKKQVWLPKFTTDYKDGTEALPDPSPEEMDAAIKAGTFVTNGITRVLHAKGTEVHAAAVTGDTVGDPFKDTSGPALNIVMKLMAILSLVFADFFVAINDGHGLLDLTWPRLPERLEIV